MCQISNIEYPGSKLPKITLGGYSIFILKDEDLIIQKLEEVLKNERVNHYIVDKSYVYVEWVSNITSQRVMDNVKKLSKRCSKSCESSPNSGNVMVWSEEDRKYLNCGPVKKY